MAIDAQVNGWITPEGLRQRLADLEQPFSPARAVHPFPASPTRAARLKIAIDAHSPRRKRVNEWIRQRLANPEQPLSPARARLKKAIGALSPRSKRAYRLGPSFDPFLGTCPYPFPEVSGGISIPPRTVSQLDDSTGVEKRTASHSEQEDEFGQLAIGGYPPEPTPEPATCSKRIRSGQHGDYQQTKARPADRSELHFMPTGQTTLGDIEARLPDHIKFMQRSSQMHMAILEDPRMRIWLPGDNNIHEHVFDVVRALISWRSSLRFKIGISIDAVFRFSKASYAYLKPGSKLSDGVRYEGMHVVWVHQTRSTVAMAEHLLINVLLHSFGSKIANKKKDMDINQQNKDGSDDERYDAPGPHYLYIAWGEPGPCNRK